MQSNLFNKKFSIALLFILTKIDKKSSRIIYKMIYSLMINQSIQKAKMMNKSDLAENKQ